MHTTQARVARLIAIVLLAALPLAAAAQDARGTITGTVVDASKSLVPGASVTATNIAMGTEMSAVTNADGILSDSLPDSRRLQGHRRALGIQEVGARDASTSASPIGCSSRSRSKSAARSRK